MGFLDAILGRTTPPKANLEVLFSVPQAALSLEVQGFAFLGQGAVCFRDSEGSADDDVIAEVEQVITVDEGATIERTQDEYGFTWLSVHRPAGDAVSIATDLHALNSSLADHGFGTALLCSTFLFEHQGRRLALVYLFKRGTFYPFVPADGGSQRRDNALELQIRGIIERDVPVEKDLGRWLAIWGAPGLE
ncbi:hypothetical protein [uncultured Aeromicrobium sp.]|uniref:PspA-associated protein PspAB n=1 Tax=uncultured Aeromicrobium sp. TaxID=337820 RepID=UPI0025F44511|nr:hypothetical protein [uncultured Aeromicrobium sp.]